MGTGSWTGPPWRKGAPRVGISSSVFEMRSHRKTRFFRVVSRVENNKIKVKVEKGQLTILVVNMNCLLVLKSHRLAYHSATGWRVVRKKK